MAWRRIRRHRGNREYRRSGRRASAALAGAHISQYRVRREVGGQAAYTQLDLATETELKLVSTLKQYFPVVVNLFAAVGMKSDIALNFLSRWQTLHELRRAKTHTVRSFFYAHNSRSQSLIEKRASTNRRSS
jgi:hypothetical protein